VDLYVLALVLLAAAAHAAWNAWLKDSADRLSSIAALAVGWLIVGCISIPIVGVPDTASWPDLLAASDWFRQNPSLPEIW
jgi:hypothetical protein